MANRLVTSHRAALQFWEVGRVPVLAALPPDGQAPRAAVILQHGSQQSKETRLSEMLPLAGAGLLAVAPDAPAHGARWDPERLERLGTDRAHTITGIAVEAAQDIAAIAEWLQQQFGIGPDRLGLHGSSMGGAAALVAVPLVRPRAAVALKTMGSLRHRWRLRLDEEVTATSAAIDGDMMSLIERFDPAAHLIEFAPTALLLVAGENDPIALMESLRELHANLLSRYAALPEHLKLVTYPGGHVTPSPVKAEARSWLL